MKFPFLRTYFSFSKGEKNGLLVLLAILLVTIGINLLLPVLVPGPQYDFREWEKEVAAYRKRMDRIGREQSRLHLVPFNPNKVSREELQAMGIGEKPASHWANYLRRGGHFRRPEDIGKIYDLPDSVCEKIIPYLQMGSDTLPGTVNRAVNPSPEKVIAADKKQTRATAPHRKELIPVVDLNRADSVRLEKLPGIGPVLAGRIVKYRKLLGGFYSIRQLKEVYGMKEEYYEKVEPYLEVTEGSLRRIRVNFASLGDLVRHPYIDYREARAIVNRREKLGKIENFDALNDIFLPEKVEKLHPYIIFAP